MLFMVIERFKERAAKAVYRRFRAEGRGAPAGLPLCRQLDRGQFRALLPADGMRRRAPDAAMGALWGDLVEFEIVPVVPPDPRDARAAA